MGRGGKLVAGRAIGREGAQTRCLMDRGGSEYDI